MKLIRKTALLAGISLLLACNLNGQWGKRVKGNGNEVTIERSVGSYDAVALSGWFDVDLVSGSEGNLTLSGEENLLEHVVTEVKNGKLQIRTEKGYQLKPSSWKTGGIRITVPVESIEEITLSGSGDIVGKTPMKASRFHAGMSGSGDITLEVMAEDLEATLSGSGDIELSGTADRFEVRVSGSGDVKAFELEADEVEATVSGSADLRVTANEVLYARVSGSGDIYYRGNPSKVDSKTSGSGDITKS
jgi:hypothetical protein